MSAEDYENYCRWRPVAQGLEPPEPWPCFDSTAQWREWWWTAKYLLMLYGKSNDPGIPCVDCTRCYQQRMINERRCTRPRQRVDDDE